MDKKKFYKLVEDNCIAIGTTFDKMFEGYRSLDVFILFENYCGCNKIPLNDKSFRGWFELERASRNIPIKETTDTSIIKTVCKEIGITQKELAERIGMSADSLNTIASSGKVSKQTIAAINLVIENERLKNKIADYELLKEAFKKALS